MGVALGAWAAPVEKVVRSVPVVDDCACIDAEHADVVRASRPRFGWTAIRVNSLVVRVWAQCLVVPTAVPVSSAWTTGSFTRRSFSQARNGVSRPAASACTAQSHPVETLTPTRSSNSSAVRSTGRCWRSSRYVAKARTSGPKRTRALASRREVGNRLGPAIAPQPVANMVGHDRHDRGEVDDLA